MKTKVVNIYPTQPILRINPPIRSYVKNVTKSIDEIRTCLLERAMVEEILDNGSIIRLDNTNYDKDNNVVVTEEPAAPVNPEKEEDPVEQDTEGDSAEQNAEGDSAESTVTSNNVIDRSSKEWQDAYNKALDGKDLGSMSRKQRRNAEFEARKMADKAIMIDLENNEKIETEDTVEETADVVVKEDVAAEVENPAEESDEIETMDIESIL